MKIRVDNREQELLKYIRELIVNIPLFKDLEVQVENLPLGDIIISNNVEDKLIIERKSINDLASSIKDGRYEEQSYRLNGLNHPNHNIIYLIEGDVNRVNRFKDNKMEKLTLYSSIFSLNYYKGFSVIRSFSIDESAIFICNTANKLRKGEAENKLPYYQNNQTILKPISLEEKQQNSEEIICNEEISGNDKDYVSVVKKIKKDNITPDNIGEIMLCQIPGISSITALAIMSKFKTFPNLISQIQENENCLKDISYTNSKNQVRKVNKTCLVNIVKFLLKK
jgi:crossover junction endonuclease MUS81